MTATATTAFRTTVNVPTRHVRDLMTLLSRAGITVLDTGERVTTDAGLDAEATLHLAHMPFDALETESDACVLGVPR